MFTKLIDSTFLANETNTLARKNNQLKNSISELEQLRDNLLSNIQRINRDIENLSIEKVSLIRDRDNLIGEKEGLEVWLKTYQTTGKQRIDGELRAYRENIAKEHSQQLEQNRITRFSQLTKEYETKRKSLESEYQSRVKVLEFSYSEKLESLEKEYQERVKEADTRLSSKIACDEKEYSEAVKDLENNLQAKKTELANEIKDLEELKKEAEEVLLSLQSQSSELIERFKNEGLSQIALDRKAFEIDCQTLRNQIEETRLQAETTIRQKEDELRDKTQSLRERFYGEFQQTILIPELEARDSEIAKLYAKIEKLQKGDNDNSFWKIEEIKKALFRELDKGTLRPNHARIMGESESGKSNFINKTLTTGFNYFGIQCDIELHDPFPSDTNWSIEVAFQSDPEATFERVVEVGEFLKSDKAKRVKPLLIVIDECDRLLRQFGKPFANTILDIFSGGRHKNIILWVMGQNGNANKWKPLEWTDFDNCCQIALGQTSLQYLKNGLKDVLTTQQSNRLKGQYENIAEETEYLGIIRPKRANPYVRAIPFSPFPGDEDTGIQCVKCESTNTKKIGKTPKTNKQRYQCNDCKKTWSEN